MSLSKLWEMVKDRRACCAAVHGVTKSQTCLSDWTMTTTVKFSCSIVGSLALVSCEAVLHHLIQQGSFRHLSTYSVFLCFLLSVSQRGLKSLFTCNLPDQSDPGTVWLTAVSPQAHSRASSCWWDARFRYPSVPPIFFVLSVHKYGLIRKLKNLCPSSNILGFDSYFLGFQDLD